MAALYDTIGQDYRCYRQPDPRIRDAIVHRLGDARTVVNIGAGTGSYEPSDRLVVAVEPSMVMIRQRSSGRGFGTTNAVNSEFETASKRCQKNSPDRLSVFSAEAQAKRY